MIDLSSSTFLIGIAIGLVTGFSFAGWWVSSAFKRVYKPTSWR